MAIKGEVRYSCGLKDGPQCTGQHRQIDSNKGMQSRQFKCECGYWHPDAMHFSALEEAAPELALEQMEQQLLNRLLKGGKVN